MMLGKVLERINPGMTYEQIVMRDVFTPLGVTRARIGGSLQAQAGPGEVRYHPVNPYIAGSVLSQAQPIVPGQYGSWNQGNLDAEGGWVLAAPDYAKVLGSFSLGDANPLLDTNWTNHMWSTVNANYPYLLRGWFKTDVLSNGNWKILRHHNGELPGTATFCCVRSDNVGFCLFINRDHWLGDNPNGIDLSGIADQVVQWPNHDLFPTVGLPAFRAHVGGTFTAYGSGCQGSAGVPGHAGFGTPEVGQGFSLRVANVPSATLAFACVGFSRTSWFGNPLPLPVGGAPGCDLLSSSDFVLSTLTNAGAGAIPVNVPANQAYLGLHLYSQYAVLDASANSLGVSFSNGLDTHLGGWQ
jgi:CubicO group peptidase (beta-lactamase class C family)